MLMMTASILSLEKDGIPASLARRRRRRNPAAESDGVRVGTSGWHYTGWLGAFYPSGTRAGGMLAHYALTFNTTEINGSFYRVPTEKAVKSWHDQTPPGFLFAWKASRFVTHNKKLRDVKDNVAFIMDRMKGLREKFGPVLWQLPPSLKYDRERLARFIAVLPREHRHVIEFRHRSWYVPDILQLLSDHDIALCISDHADAPAPWVATAGHVYVRLHGTSGRYVGHYSDADLERLAERIRGWRSERRAVFCYFDNDVRAAAPEDATILLEKLARRAPARTRML
jgi:uncharacterized protein YecE (DUF72 family)